MATTNASASTQTQEFEPPFKRVEMKNDSDDAFACIAMIAGKTLEEIRQTAIDKFKHSKHGPATCWVAWELISKLLGHYGFLATPYRECTGITTLPELAMGLVEYDPDTEIGRHVVFHRAKGPKGMVEYIIDPAYWVGDPNKQVRTDIKGFPIAWWIGVTHPQTTNNSAAKGGK